MPFHSSDRFVSLASGCRPTSSVDRESTCIVARLSQAVTNNNVRFFVFYSSPTGISTLAYFVSFSFIGTSENVARSMRCYELL